METPVELMPPVNPVIANGVLKEVDNLIDWHQNAISKTEKAGIRLARLIADISQNGYWIVRGYTNEVEYIKTTFPQSESQYYILRRIGTTLRQYPVHLLEEIGISKCQDLVRIHNSNNGVIDPQWFMWAKIEKRNEFRRRVQTAIGKALPPAPDEGDLMVTFKVWKDAIPVYNKAFEIAALLAGTDKSKSHLFLNFILPEWLSGMDEDGARLMGDNNFNLMIIERAIANLNDEKDPTIWDRLIGKVRCGLEAKKSK
jgi:hypothetical protein